VNQDPLLEIKDSPVRDDAPVKEGGCPMVSSQEALRNHIGILRIPGDNSSISKGMVLQSASAIKCKKEVSRPPPS